MIVKEFNCDCLITLVCTDYWLYNHFSLYQYYCLRAVKINSAYCVTLSYCVSIPWRILWQAWTLNNCFVLSLTDSLSLSLSPTPSLYLSIRLYTCLSLSLSLLQYLSVPRFCCLSPCVLFIVCQCAGSLFYTQLPWKDELWWNHWHIWIKLW